MFIDDDEAQKKARTRSKVGLRVFKKKKNVSRNNTIQDNWVNYESAGSVRVTP